MRPAEVIAEVARFYVPGTIGFYADQRPDPWQAAHDEYERALGKSEQVWILAGSAFLARLRELTARYERDREPALPGLADMFTLGTVAKSDEWHSKVSRSCAHCRTTQNLVIKRIPGESKTKLVCKNCAVNPANTEDALLRPAVERAQRGNV